MGILNYNFQWYRPWGNGILSLEDLRFFYYDIAKDNISGLSKMYEWNDTIKSFLEKNHLTIEECDNILEDEINNNTILFKIRKNKNTGEYKETKAMSFFRHLRNAFAHYNIKCENNYYYIRDFDYKKKITMIGAINCDLLRDLCFLFLSQGDVILQSSDDCNQQRTI